MLDSRLPARPYAVRVPLYPTMSINDKTIVLAKKSIDNYFQHIAKNATIHFANSATEALISWLRAKFNKKLTIALPSFFCPHVSYYLYLEGHELILYNIDCNDLFISDIDINNLINQPIDIFVLPSFFGYRNNIENKVKLLKQRSDMNIIVDLAQAFPLENLNYLRDNRTAFLFSFGKSKALATIGGGAIISPTNCETVLVFNQKPSSNIIDQPKVALESDLKLLLAKKFDILLKKDAYPLEISALHMSIKKQINVNYNRYLGCINILRERYERIKSIINHSSKSNILSFYRELADIPTILALNIESHGRYNSSIFLAKYGIESTWYYYPLHLQRLYQKKNCNNFSSTEKIARSILIVPFSLNQSDYEFNTLANALEELL